MRLTPYDLVFGTSAFDDGGFERLREQVEAHGGPTAAELLGLPAAGELLRSLLPDGAGEEHREQIAQIGALLFHAFRFWLHGRIVYLLSDDAVRGLIEQAPHAWRYRTPAPAGYVQLPRNRFWARPIDDAAAEPLDGFFWSAPEETEGATGERLDLLAVLGVRADRPGLTVVSVSLEPGADLAQWADVDARPGATDFDNILPGGELQGYHALATHAELIKLAIRTFRHIDRHPDRITDEAGVRRVDNG